ncbi:MAG: Ig-like domain-containing protein [Cyanobacteria bacterium FC1]|nr:Ig-like domain-containing protein [Cyanobacteria bacterium FC1]
MSHNLFASTQNREISASLVLSRCTPSNLKQKPASESHSIQLHQILFIDESIADYKTLAEGALPGIEVIILNPAQNAIEQITQLLAQRQRLNSLHLVTHGKPASLDFSTGSLNQTTIPHYAPQLKKWAASLAPQAEILLYGCNVAQGEIGETFVRHLSQLTGATIAAAKTPVGNSNLGGTWNLAYQTRNINTALPFNTCVLQTYPGILPTLDWSVLNWPSAGALSASYTNVGGSGINIDLEVTLNNNATLTANLPSYGLTPNDFGFFNGGYPTAPEALIFHLQVPPNIKPERAMVLTVKFNQLVNDVNFQIYDIDKAIDNAWQDEVVITGFNGGSSVGAQFIQSNNPSYTILGNVITGTALSENRPTGSVTLADTTRGNLTVYFPNPVDSFEIVFREGPDSVNTPIAHGIALLSNVVFNNTVRLIPNEISQVEGDTGTTAYNYTAVLSDVSYIPVTVNYTTNDGTATVADNDFVANNGTLTFAPRGLNNPTGEMEKPIVVQVVGDTRVEPDENFTVRLNSSQGAAIDPTAREALGIIIDDDNNPPIATGILTNSTPNNTAIAIPTLTATENDPGDSIANFTITQIPLPTEGTLLLNGQPVTNGQILTPAQAAQLTFQPNSNFEGNATFRFLATDTLGDADSNIATVTIPVTAIPNQPPNATNLAAPSTPNNTPVTVPTLSATDPDNDPIASFTITAIPPANQGTLLLNGQPVSPNQVLTPAEAAQLTFQPDPNFVGDATFSYTATDSRGAVDPTPATVTLPVTQANRPPQASDDGAATEPDTPVTIDVLANDSDPDNNLNPASVRIPQGGEPANGTVTINPVTGAITYTPNPGFTEGTDTFTYQVCDTGNPALCDTATVTIIVPIPANQPPVADSKTADPVANNAIAPIPPLSATDPDGDPIASFTITGFPPPNQGTLLLNGIPVDTSQPLNLTPAQAAQLTFQPAPGFVGDATFSYTATDNRGATDPTPATIRIPVTAAANQPPDTNPATNTLAPNTTTALTQLGGTDPDGTVQRFQITSLPDPTQGQLLFNGQPVTLDQEIPADQIGNLQFQSTPGFTGATFNYAAIDNQGAVDPTPAQVTLNPAAINQPPQTDNITAPSTPNNTPVVLPPLTGSDPDPGDRIERFIINTVPPSEQGTLLLNGNPVTPGQSLTPEQASQLTFVPNPNFTGNAIFSYAAVDTLGAVSPRPGDVTIPVSAANRPPDTNPVTETIAPNTTSPIPGLGGNDPDAGDTISRFRITSLPDPTQGTLLFNGQPVTVGQEIPANQIGNLQFRSTPEFNGTGFTYAAIDNQDAVDPTPEPVTLRPENLPPNTLDAARNILPNSNTPITGLGGTDEDGTVSQFRITSLPEPTQGTLLLNGQPVTVGQNIPADQINNLVFQSTPGFTGATFDYAAIDNNEAIDPLPATVTLGTIPNQPPASENLNQSVFPGSTVPVPRLAGSDPDGEVEFYRIDTLPPANQGILYLGDPNNGGTPVTPGQQLTPEQASRLFFQSTGNFTQANFTYRAFDDLGKPSPEPGTVSLAPPAIANRPPRADNAANPIAPNSAIGLLPLSANDPDGSIQFYTITNLPPQNQGILYLGDPNNGGTPVTAGQQLTPEQASQLFFQSTGNFTGANFTFSATDNRGATTPANGTVSLTPSPAINQPPVANNVNVSALPGSLIPVTGLLATDPDGEVDFYRIDTLPPAAQGTLFLRDPLTNQLVPVQAGQQINPEDRDRLFFQAAGNFTGTNFTYSAVDDRGESTPARATVALISPEVNQPPIVRNVNTPVVPGQVLPISGMFGQDPDGSIAFYTIETLPPPEQGILYLGDPGQGGVPITLGQQLTPAQINQLFFRPTGQFTGASFTYRATDNEGLVAPAAGTVSLLGGILPPPIALPTPTPRPIPDLGGEPQPTPPPAPPGVPTPPISPTPPPVSEQPKKDCDCKCVPQSDDPPFVAPPARPSPTTLYIDNEIFGNLGNDSLLGNQGDDTIYGGKGNDTIHGGKHNDLLFGHIGDDSLLGNQDNDTLFGDLGNDWLHGGKGNDWLFGGKGNDTLLGDRDNDVVRGHQGDDSLLGNQGDDTLYGDRGNDIIHGGKNNDLIFGGKGNDTLSGDQGSDTVYGHLGDDSILGNQGNDTLFGDRGNDTIYGGKGDDLIYGGKDNDTLSGDQGNDIIYGHLGDDSILGNQCDDTLYGDRGNDTIYGGKGNDLIFGGKDNDTLSGDQDCDTVYGQLGDDSILGNQGDDILFGGQGNDTIYGGKGEDLIFGGKDNDTLSGDQGNDTVYGDLGDDSILGNQGNDILFGGQGNDIIFGGKDNDIIFGGKDNDTLFGDQGSDTLYGDRGDDSLMGNDGNDFLYGVTGNNVLWGGKGNDWLQGGDGNDTLIGDRGQDTLIGGGGSDWFILRTPMSSKTLENSDRILDFQVNLDWIGLTDGLTSTNLVLEGLANGTAIRISQSNTYLAVVDNVRPDQLSGRFMSVEISF